LIADGAVKIEDKQVRIGHGGCHVSNLLACSEITKNVSCAHYRSMVLGRVLAEKEAPPEGRRGFSLLEKNGLS
jgi:hypothetical protein